MFNGICVYNQCKLVKLQPSSNKASLPIPVRQTGPHAPHPGPHLLQHLWRQLLYAVPRQYAALMREAAAGGQLGQLGLDRQGQAVAGSSGHMLEGSAGPAWPRRTGQGRQAGRHQQAGTCMHACAYIHKLRWP